MNTVNLEPALQDRLQETFNTFRGRSSLRTLGWVINVENISVENGNGYLGRHFAGNFFVLNEHLVTQLT
jgi:hypothetical protein